MATYGSEELEKFTLWKQKLEGLGVEFEDTSKDTSTSLDDILESFNTKMNAILDKLNLLAGEKPDETKPDDEKEPDDTQGSEDDNKTETA